MAATKHGAQQVIYGTKAEVEAITNVAVGTRGVASDTLVDGVFNGSAWVWNMVPSKIAELSLSGVTNVTFTNIPQIYESLHLVIYGRSTSAGQNSDGVNLQINGDTGNNYDRVEINSYASPNTARAEAQAQLFVGNLAAAAAPSSTPGLIDIVIPFYTQTSFYKTLRCESGYFQNLTEAWGKVESFQHGFWRGTAAITSIKVALGVGSGVAGTKAVLYGA